MAASYDGSLIDLPIAAVNSKSLIDLIDANIAALDGAFTEMARREILLDGDACQIAIERRFTKRHAQPLQQAIRTLRQIREAVSHR